MTHHGDTTDDLSVSHPMTETVELGGTTLHVTPISVLPFPYSISAGVIASRLVTKINRTDEDEPAEGIDEDMYQLLELCVEDGISRETIENLGPYELSAIIGAAFEEPDEDGAGAGAGAGTGGDDEGEA